jgi:hypothetical protein
MAKSKSAKYYNENPESRKKKQAYDKKLNAKPSQIKKRAESNAKRREAKAAGKDINGKDFDHAVGRFVSVKTNRGRVGEGGRKKK